MAAPLKLISHKLCPYVQRAVIALTEKGVPFERIDIDLASKPDWFLKISPLGKTPVLVVGDKAIFESAVILEYLEETQGSPLHPADALERAEHRGWIEFGSAVLNDIAGFYAAKDEATFKAKAAQLEEKLARLEARVAAAPWFDGEKFSLVDAVFGPVFRYFDVFDAIGDFGILAGKQKLAQWRRNLAARPSVRGAVSADYPALLRDFIDRRQSWLSQLQAGKRKAA
ncbi:glutathione S-transferase family protein [Bradyrhizobium sp.]|uniref:glutathione S-transferase family protein n=1 Tax=Bradyrhizobium sp. TaxID=376 RepID=UPI001D838766|nr:glutathione S-transferase family protein [Bradyrhizobium sp.]MBI5319391.1 glutathione S-transferase family protein [Bradyrhizobium sp.]